MMQVIKKKIKIRTNKVQILTVKYFHIEGKLYDTNCVNIEGPFDYEIYPPGPEVAS